MQFEWDSQKNTGNLRKHGLDFSDANQIFAGPILEALDTRADYGEERFVGIGLLQGRVVVVVYTERGEETIRIISLRKALTHEAERYAEYLRNQLGAG
jgi:uncharacterized DUF497 family protein